MMSSDSEGGALAGPRHPVVSRLRRIAPVAAYRLWAWLTGGRFTIPPGRIRWGDLRRSAPLSRSFGYDRGTPVDRYYIERFLARHSGDIAGRVLEVKDDTYTRRFGGQRVSSGDVLDIDAGNPRATIVADLAAADGIPPDAFDCIVLTQVLQLIYDLPAAARSLHRALRPGGVLLVTIPGISQVAYRSLGHTWHWAFTEASARRLFEDAFAGGSVDVAMHGNVLAATALLQGLAVEEVRTAELDVSDADYQVIITVRAVKREEG